eukprot:Gb_34792 [translate_table: standard]
MKVCNIKEQSHPNCRSSQGVFKLLFAAVNENGQHNLAYLALQQTKRVDYAVALVLYLTYPVVVEMLHHFELGALWFYHKVVSIDGELIAEMTRFSMEGATVDLKEEAKGIDKDWVMQKLYPGCNREDVRSKSNGFHVNCIIDEGAKWATRIIPTKVAMGHLYAWAPWLANKLEDHCTTLQMSRHPFPMPSLVATICMEALGPPRWIEPRPQPRLNLYLRLQRRKGDKKDKVATTYLGNFYTTLRWLNDGSEKNKRGHSASTEKDDHLKDKETYESRKKKQKVGEAKGKKEQEGRHKDSIIPPSVDVSNNPKSMIASSSLNTLWNVITTIPLFVSSINVVASTSTQPVVSQVPLTQWCQIVLETYPSIESSLDIVPPPAFQRVKEKRKGPFIPTVQISNDALTTQADGGDLLLHEISMFDTLLSEEQSTLDVKIQSDLCPHIHLLRQKALAAKETPPLPPEVQTKLAHLEVEATPTQLVSTIQEQLALARNNVDKLKGQVMRSVDNVSKEERLRMSQLARLVELYKQRATKKETLEEGYQELSRAIDTEQ